MNDVVREVNAKRLLCPMPVIRLQQAVEQVSAGECVAVLATDPGVLHDIPAWCRVNGHHVLEQTESDGVYRFVVSAG